MKINAKLLLSLLLTVLLLASLPVAAFAADLELTVGEAREYCIEQRADPGYITGVNIVSGSCPGMALEVASDGTAAYLRGTPTQAGDFTLSVSVQHSAGDAYTPTISIHVADATTPTPTPTPTAELPVEPTQTPTPEVIVEESPAPKLAITKDPTGETKVEGGSAVFIARADGATEIVWLLVSSDGKTTYQCADAPSHFSGLRVSGLGTERLELSNLPLSISGWTVQAMFNGEGGPLYSKGAVITVNRAQLNAPTIITQPKGVDANGEPVTLRVVASTTEGELRYQWYKSSSNRNVGGLAIVGATGSSFTPTETEGTCYYYVTVWAVSGDRSSTSVTSGVATVNFGTAAPTPTPAPTSTPEPTPEPAETPAVEDTPAADTTSEPEPSETPAPEAPARRSSSPALVVAAVLLLLGAAASVGVYIYLRRRDMAEADENEDDEE